MDASLLKDFFMWCLIINAGMLCASFLILGLAGDLIYRLHSRWFSMPREAFNCTLYSMLGHYKLGVILLNLTPWIALTILS